MLAAIETFKCGTVENKEQIPGPVLWINAEWWTVHA